MVAAAAAARRKSRFVAYLRVSTDQQGLRGLGMDAQRASIAGFIDRAGGEAVAEFVEVESGKRADRPQLRLALAAAQRLNARLITAKLDRLSRSVNFISGLMESGVDFIIVDLPEANRLTLHIMAAFAEHEREAISRRTKEALAAAKARGVKLGNPNLTAASAAKGRALGLAAVRARAQRFKERMSGQVNRLRGEGNSLRAIAAVLNEEGTLTASGKGNAWTACGVLAVLQVEDAGVRAQPRRA